MFPAMRFAVPAVLVALLSAACGGPGIPAHSGYKQAKAQPWKKAKVIALDEKLEGKADGELDYREYKRARWFAIDLPSDGELSVSMEAAPATEDEEFDLALEVLDPNFQSIFRSGLDEEDAHELIKSTTLYQLKAGRYLVHVYLQRRIDASEFDLKVKFAPAAIAYESDFPAKVPFPPRLAVVPLEDDTPENERPKIVRKPTGKRKPSEKPVAVAPPVSNVISGKIINVGVSGGGTTITINRGTDQGVADGMQGKVTGIKQGSFTLSGCSSRSCRGVVKATPDEVNRSGKVVITP
jgi:hypothetical protein